MDLSAIRMGDKFGKEAASVRGGERKGEKGGKEEPNHSEYKTKNRVLCVENADRRGQGVQDTGSHHTSRIFLSFSL